MKLCLKIPDENDRKQVLDFAREFMAESPEHIPGAPSLAQVSSYEKWLMHIQKDINDPGKGRVPATQYIGVREEVLVIAYAQANDAKAMHQPCCSFV